MPLVQLGINIQVVLTATAQLLKVWRHNFRTTETHMPRNTSNVPSIPVLEEQSDLHQDLLAGLFDRGW